ncbi:N-methyl-D-aspartate receptor NMDAR2C subunit [Patescibacteria group bacterium AH-259-L07]|nr:N-methyl-D-aspartate receptor NMDAR2C subunit [Patescibacteria group bacterium AH-259-L07]
MKNKQRWVELWQRIGAYGDPLPVYKNLVTRYAEPHRAYHTLSHIVHCLDEFDLVRDIATNPNAIEMAIWYHDVIYNTRRTDNEEKSAAIAQRVVKSARLPKSFGKRVAELIIATKHDILPEHTDKQILVDVDLSILGQSEETFDEYEQQIRKEYDRVVPETVFNEKRSSILKSFLKRPSIYLTSFFREKYEAQAQQNIERSRKRLQILKQKSP